MAQEQRYQPQRDDARAQIEAAVVKAIGPPVTREAHDRLVAIADAATTLVIDDRIRTIEAAVSIARELGFHDVAHTIETCLGAGL